jgi:2-polyprenyl-3-methyl-5-hydroxy-6-metoxy-1,4-benzoquinol methylase
MPNLIQCPLCNTSNFKPYAARIRKNYPHVLRVICTDCGLILSNPQATTQELGVFYQNYYDRGNFSAWKHKIQIWKDNFDKGLTSEVAPFLFKNLPAPNPTVKWLEVGAGLGQLSYVARSRGFAVTATELDNDAVSYLKTEMGMKDILLGSLESLYPGTLKDGDYDIVVMNHVLEHVTDLIGTLNIVHQVLKTGGVFYIGVPNLDNYGYHLYNALCHFMMKIPGIVDGIEHTFGFTPKTLRLCLKRTGFDIQQIRTFGKGETPSSLLKLWRVNGLPKTSAAFAESIFRTRMDCIAIKPYTSPAGR